MKKRLLSLLLALVLIYTMLPELVTTAEAAGSISEAEVAERLSIAETKWKNGAIYDDSKALCKQCYGFCRELFYYVFNESLPTLVSRANARFAGTKYMDNVIEIGHLSTGYSLSDLKMLLLLAKPGDVLIASSSTYNHFVMVRSVVSDGSGIYVYDANWDWHNGIRTNALWSAETMRRTRPIGVTLYRYVNYATDSTQPEAATHTTHVKGSYLWCEKAHPHYNYWTCSVCGQRFTDGSTSTVESCAACGTVEPPAAVTEITFSGLTVPGNLTEGNGGHVNGYIYSSNSPICSVTAEVYNESGQISLSASSRNFSVSKYGPIKNSKIDKDLKFETLSAGTYYIQYTAEAEDGTTVTAATDAFTITGQLPAHTAHEKGTYLWCEAAHPHNNYYICSVCGEKFTDGSTSYVESCTTCNPPQDTEIIEEPSEPETTVEPWSGWSTTPAYASDTREVETRQVQVSGAYTEYRYGRYVDAPGRNDCWCAKYLESLPYVSGSAILQYSGWSTSRYGTSGKDWSCGYCSGSHTGVDHTGSDGRAWWHEYLLPGGSYYWEESRTVPAVYETQYRYRDRIG